MKRINLFKNLLAGSLILFLATSLNAQEKIEDIPYGHMNNWMVRTVKESGLIGGHTRVFHEIVEGDTLVNEPYKNTKSPWALSSVLAKVSGVTKASVTVFPETRGNGRAARLETRIENVKVLGLLNINVLASGTIFLGEMVEPITDTDNPMSKLNAGIPFTKRPEYVQYDYKVVTGGNCIKSTGFGGKTDMNKKDQAEVFLFLQHRWEDADGNIFAKRVATAWENFFKTETEWQNNHKLPIHYGDISQKLFYRHFMGLRDGEQASYARNSKGKMMPIKEVGWATNNEPVTHMMLQFSSSNGGAYIGSVDSRFWVDNVKLIY